MSTDDTTETDDGREFAKPPQTRSTEVIFDHARPYVRATATDESVTFAVRSESETAYTHALTLEGRAGVAELRDYLDAWLAADADGGGGA